jgi:hypothetical protein
LINSLSKEFDEVLDKDLFNLRISNIEENTAIIIFEIPVSKYNFKIEDRIKKQTSIYLLNYLSKN